MLNRNYYIVKFELPYSEIDLLHLYNSGNKVIIYSLSGEILYMIMKNERRSFEKWDFMSYMKNDPVKVRIEIFFEDVFSLLGGWFNYYLNLHTSMLI